MTTSTARTRARKGEGDKLRERLLEAAEELLVDAGHPDNVSVRAIATAAQCTPPSIYLHFADKTELLAAVCEMRFRDLDRSMEEAAAAASSPVEALWARGRAYVRFGLDNPEHYRILFMTRPGPDRPAKEPADLPGLTAFSHLVEEVARCMDAGAIAAGDPFLVATSLWTSVHGITSLLIARPDFPWPDLDRLMGLVVEVQSKGLQAPA